MTWLAIRMFLGGAVSKLWAFLRSLSFWQIMSLALAIALGLQTLRLGSEQRHASKLSTQLSKVIAAREADRKAYVQAQKDAAAKNDQQVTQIKQKQQEITDARVSDLNARLELIRSELRKAAASGASGGAKAGDPRNAPCRAYDPAWLCVAPEDRLRGAEDEERHDQLITWVEQQSKIDTNH